MPSDEKFERVKKGIRLLERDGVPVVQLVGAGVLAEAAEQRVEPGTQDGVEWVPEDKRERYATSGVGWPD